MSKLTFYMDIEEERLGEEIETICNLPVLVEFVRDADGFREGDLANLPWDEVSRFVLDGSVRILGDDFVEREEMPYLCIPSEWGSDLEEESRGFKPTTSLSRTLGG